jgi:hypothetical protein
VTPHFSIVVPHYDGSISDDLLVRGMRCLADQADAPPFEVLLYHDGPPSRPLPDLTFLGERLALVEPTEQRHNDWGHSLRDRGIRAARGEYIVHFNPDNVLYPQALARLAHHAALPIQPAPPGVLPENPAILIFAVLMRGMIVTKRAIWRDRERTGRAALFAGMPARHSMIDAMQAVIRREVWLEIGGWYDKRETSDGYIYPPLIAARGARYVPEILGEHW